MFMSSTEKLKPMKNPTLQVNKGMSVSPIFLSVKVTNRQVHGIYYPLSWQHSMIEIHTEKLQTAGESPTEQCSEAIWNSSELGEIPWLLKSEDFFKLRKWKEKNELDFHTFEHSGVHSPGSWGVSTWSAFSRKAEWNHFIILLAVRQNHGVTTLQFNCRNKNKLLRARTGVCTTQTQTQVLKRPVPTILQVLSSFKLKLVFFHWSNFKMLCFCYVHLAYPILFSLCAHCFSSEVLIICSINFNFTVLKNPQLPTWLWKMVQLFYTL